MRAGITIGEVRGKIASTRPRGESDAVWATRNEPMSRIVSGVTTELASSWRSTRAPRAPATVR